MTPLQGGRETRRVRPERRVRLLRGPPKLGELTGISPRVLTKRLVLSAIVRPALRANFVRNTDDSSERSTKFVGRSLGFLSASRERGCAARCGSHPSHGLSFLSAGDLCPCGVRGLCVEVSG